MHLALEMHVIAFDEEGDFIGCRFAQTFHPRLLALGEIAEYVGIDERLVAGVADAEAHASIIIAHMRGDRAQTVVSGIAAADLHTQLSRREVELVVEHDDVVELDLVEPRRLVHGAAGIVHESLRLDQDDALAGDLAFAATRLEVRAERRKSIAPRDRLDRHEADIVATARMSRTGIAEADEEQHGDLSTSVVFKGTLVCMSHPCRN